MGQSVDGTIGVIGLGYVGLPLALAFREAGYDVVGVDIDEQKIRQLQEGVSYITDIDDGEIVESIGNGLEVSASYEDLSDVTGVAICVPTPLRKTGQPNLSYVADASDRLAKVVPDGCIVILESTVYPGATEEMVVPKLTENGRSVGEGVFVAFSPERIDPGRAEPPVREIPKVLGGVTDACGERATDLYAPVFDEIVEVSSATEAELVKLLENTFRAINIGMINETAQIAHELDVDVWEVVEAASTKPYGFMPFYPGPGLGGHCIPVDPMYLSWKAGQQDIQTRFIDLADQVNREMPVHVVERVAELLNWEGLAVSRADILVVGVAYKADVSDVRESPAYDVIGLLAGRGATIDYHDPYVKEFEVGGKTYESVELFEETLRDADLTLVLTDHSSIDFDEVVEHSELVFDSRNATDMVSEDHVHKL